MSSPTETRRIASIDLLRGLAVLLMLFVTDAAGIFTTPNWLRETAGGKDTLGLGDFCVPWFLFVCGAAIPIAFQQQLSGNSNRWMFAFHILTRTISLWLMGILMVNAPYFGGNWRAGLWEFILITALIVGWMDWPKSLNVSPVSQSLFRITAMIIIAVLSAYYGSRDGQWLTLRGWGTLGVIGWGYLIGAIAYWITRGNAAGLVAIAAILLAASNIEPTQWLERLQARQELGELQPYAMQLADYWVRLDQVVDFGGLIGPLGGCVTLGCVLGVILQKSRTESTRETLKSIAGLLIGLLFAAVICDAKFGLDRSQMSPAWILYSVLVACNLWLLMWAIADRAEKLWGLQWLADIGANALFAFLLVPWLLTLFQLMRWNVHQQLGQESFWNPLWRPGIMTVVVASITSLISRLGWRMHL